MAKKSNSQKKALRQQQENAALHNIFNVFLTGLVAEFYMFIVYKFYVAGSINSIVTWDSILRVLVWVGLAAFAGCGIVAYCKRGDKKLFKPLCIGSAVGAFVGVTSWVSTRFFDDGVAMLCSIIPVVTVLALVYFLYQRECFISTMALAAALLGVWVCDKGMGGYWNTLVMIAVVVLAVLLVGAAVVLRKAGVNGGKVKGIQVLSPEGDSLVVTIACILGAVVALAAMLVPAIAYYLIWVLVIALFAELVYYTTKMM